MTNIELNDLNQKNIAKERNLLISSLGLDNYNNIYNCLIEMSKFEVDYTVFLTRKGYSLYKTFLNVLPNDFKFKSIVTNDKAIFSLEKIDQNSTILVCDDTLLYGRALTKFLNLLNRDYKIKQENIYINSFTYNEKLKNDNSLLEAKIIEDEKSKINLFSCDNIKAKIFENPTLLDEGLVLQRSKSFVNAIQATSTPYVAYTPYFEKIFNDKKELYNLIKRSFEINVEKDEDLFEITKSKNLQKYDIFSISNDIQEKYDVFSFVAMPKEQSYGSYLSIRININLCLNKIIIIPFVTTNFINNSDLEKTYNEIFPNISININNHEVVNKNMYERLSYLAGYLHGIDFLKHLGLSEEFRLKADDFSILGKKTLLVKDFDLSKFKISDRKRIFESIKSSDDEFINNFIERVSKIEKEDLYNHLYMFFSRMSLDKDSPNGQKDRYPGVPINNLIYLINNSNDKLKVNYIISQIIKICDSGIASMNANTYYENFTSCYVHNGEQTALFYSQVFDGLIYFISNIYNSSKQQWQLIKNDVFAIVEQYVSDSKKQTNMNFYRESINYIKNEENPNKFNSMDFTELFQKNNDESRFFLNLTRIYRMYREQHSIDDFKTFILSRESINYINNKDLIKIKKYIK